MESIKMKKLLKHLLLGVCILSATLILSNSAFCKYYDTEYKLNKSYIPDSQTLIQKTEKSKDGTVLLKKYTKNNKLISIEHFTNDALNARCGESVYYYENGKTKRDVLYDNNGQLDGKLLCYYPNGKTRRNDVYKHGELVKGKCYDKNGSEVAFFPYETYVEFDARAFAGNIHWPIGYVAKVDRVILKVLIGKDGSVESFWYDSAIGKMFADALAEAFEKTGRSIPASFDGEPYEKELYIPLSLSNH